MITASIFLSQTNSNAWGADPYYATNNPNEFQFDITSHRFITKNDCDDNIYNPSYSSYGINKDGSQFMCPRDFNYTGTVTIKIDSNETCNLLSVSGINGFTLPTTLYPGQSYIIFYFLKSRKVFHII